MLEHLLDSFILPVHSHSRLWIADLINPTRSVHPANRLPLVFTCGECSADIAKAYIVYSVILASSSSGCVLGIGRQLCLLIEESYRTHFGECVKFRKPKERFGFEDRLVDHRLGQATAEQTTISGVCKLSFCTISIRMFIGMLLTPPFKSFSRFFFKVLISFNSCVFDEKLNVFELLMQELGRGVPAFWSSTSLNERAGINQFEII